MYRKPEEAFLNNKRWQWVLLTELINDDKCILIKQNNKSL